MNSDVTKIVVTGASGFLGRSLINYFKNKETFIVYALSSQYDKLRQYNTSENIKYCHKDELFKSRNKSILEDSILINCAFPRNSSGTGMADGLKYIQGVFLNAKECNVKKIINISSQSVYSSKRDLAATEEMPVCLETTYAVGKYATELMLETVFTGTDISFTNIRLASLIGPGFNQRFVNRFVKFAVDGIDLTVNAGRQRYGFLDIKDAVYGIAAIINSERFDWKKVYNLGPKDGYTVEEIAQLVCLLSERYCRKRINYKINAVDDSTNSALDSTLFYKDFNWEPDMSLVSSIEEIFKNEVVK